jgi:hypothetical protein
MTARHGAIEYHSAAAVKAGAATGRPPLSAGIFGIPASFLIKLPLSGGRSEALSPGGQREGLEQK